MKKQRIREIPYTKNGRVINIYSIIYPVIIVDIGFKAAANVKETPEIFPKSSSGTLSIKEV